MSWTRHGWIACAALAACDVTDLVSLKDAAAAAALTDGDSAAAPSDNAARPPERPPLAADCSLPSFEERLLDRYDADGDGALSTDERGGLNDEFEGADDGQGVANGDRPPPFGRGGHGRRMLEMLVWVYDADDDEALSPTERAGLEADLDARCEARKAKLLVDFDADGDGALSPTELDAARTALEAEREARHAQMRAAADTDGDGAVSEAEHEAAREAHHAEREAERATFDVDGDGTLSDSEEDALKESIKEKIRSGEPPPGPPPGGPRHPPRD